MEKAKKIHTPQQTEGLFPTALISGGIGLAIILGAALLMPLLFINSDDPNSLVLPMAVICVALGGFIGGFISAKRCKGAEFISASTSVLIMILPMILISFLYKKGFSFLGFAIVLLVLIGTALLGATIVKKANGSKTHNMKKVMKKR